MAQLPIRALTISKQGIGHFLRRGRTDETTVALVVPRDSLNDVLSSLDIVIHAGGPLQSVDYETPADKAQQLAALSVQLGDRASLSDLLTGLRGRVVTVTLADGSQRAGRVVGVEADVYRSAQPMSLVLQEAAALHVVVMSELRGVAIRDADAVADINYFLDVSRSEQGRTALTVRLAPGNHDLELRYTAPSPTWRVSYRLVGDGAGRARLVGWGLFDNTLDEDLEQVELTLVSGRPVAFRYGLAETRTPTRPEVSDDPTALETTAGDRSVAEALSTLSHEIRTPLTVIRGFSDLFARGMAGTLNDDQREMITQIRDRARDISEHLNGLFDLVRIREAGEEMPRTSQFESGPLGDLKVSRSYFLPMQAGSGEAAALTYRAPAPVTVRRGQAALVPILDTIVTYTELWVYNGAKMSHHPLRVWRLRNASGLALEQGPVTVMDGAVYAGESIVRLTGSGDELQLPFALEVGVLVREAREYVPRRLRDVVFSAEERCAWVTWYELRSTRYYLASTLGREMTVLVEQRDLLGGEYIDSPSPVETNQSHTRWAVVLPAGGAADLTVTARQPQRFRADPISWQVQQVEELRAAGGLDDRAYGLLQALLALAVEEAAATVQRQRLETDLDGLRALQEQLRQNLQALGESEREVALRDQLLDDLAASEARRREIGELLLTLEEATMTRATQRQALLDELYTSSAAG